MLNIFQFWLNAFYFYRVDYKHVLLIIIGPYHNKQIWYSLRLSGKDHQLVIRTLQELIQASNLEELTRGKMNMEQNQLQKLVKVWRTWLDLSSRSEDWITDPDRVTTSNIADFVPLANLLDTYKPLLNPSNPSSVIITEFQNWVQFTNLMEEAERRAHGMVRGDSFRRKVLEDTKNRAIANSTGRQAVAEYHDHSIEFIIFLRAALLVSEVPHERKHKRTWKSVAEYNGLIARNFLRCKNRVFLAKWLLNCRRVTMLNGYERAVEWIVKPR